MGAFVNFHFPALQRTEPTFLCFCGPTVNPVGSPFLDQLTCSWADAVAVGLWSCTLLSWLYMGTDSRWISVEFGGQPFTAVGDLSRDQKHPRWPSQGRPAGCAVEPCGRRQVGWQMWRGPGFWIRLSGFLHPSPPSRRKKCQPLARLRSSVT